MNDLPPKYRAPPPPKPIRSISGSRINQYKIFKDNEKHVIPFTNFDMTKTEDIDAINGKAVISDNGKLLGRFRFKNKVLDDYSPQYYDSEKKIHNLLSNNFNFYKNLHDNKLYTVYKYNILNEQQPDVRGFYITNTEEEPLTELAPIEGGKRRRKTKRRKTNRRKTKRRR